MNGMPLFLCKHVRPRGTPCGTATRLCGVAWAGVSAVACSCPPAGKWRRAEFVPHGSIRIPLTRSCAQKEGKNINSEGRHRLPRRTAHRIATHQQQGRYTSGGATPPPINAGVQLERGERPGGSGPQSPIGATMYNVAPKESHISPTLAHAATLPPARYDRPRQQQRRDSRSRAIASPPPDPSTQPPPRCMRRPHQRDNEATPAARKTPHIPHKRTDTHTKTQDRLRMRPF